ncbi:type I-E CRISPR-associated protein Cas5/CasD [Marinomonas sp. A79]|uniref:Type I-E CRISPR-associated protein Cas5/CasD n=1 Tax=Marinomonas vulgaris TaxID=2823372 RepID=A0ABS5H7K9_9GAMM|nr:type I-E CRISPR-associated protein Cas5/CasD [Marinomonas vulgaris]MBR7887430.1 type I-E CRISPR-associated protein Cas5/CasD [Marinomonas vulgaris]
MNYLIFQLQAPLSAWGETAVGEYRPSANYPSESALIGLLAASLGIDRSDEDQHQILRAELSFAIGVQSAGRLLRDYQTAQVPGRVSLKNRSHRTRRDELNMPKEKLNTILSSRDYRQDAACLVAVQTKTDSVISLESLALAIQQPKFVLYLGRKTCPPSSPLWPQVIAAENALQAMEAYRCQLAEQSGEVVLPLERLVWGAGINAGVQEDLQMVRKDRLLSRANWQFGDRPEFVALLAQPILV